MTKRLSFCHLSRDEVGTPVHRMTLEGGITMFKRSLLSLILAAMLACSALFGCAASESSSSSAASSAVTTESSESQASSDTSGMDVTIEFDIDILEGVADTEGAVPYRGPEPVDVSEGATAYDALVATGVEVDGTPSYVTAINGVGEGLAGSASGWMYMVNDESPQVPANEYVLQEGDNVIWYYGVAGEPRKELIG